MNLDETIELLDITPSGFTRIKVKTGRFSGVVYSYGAVAFEELADELKLKFEYNILENEQLIDDVSEFKQLTGDILLAMIDKQLSASEVIYHGGKD